MIVFVKQMKIFLEECLISFFLSIIGTTFVQTVIRDISIKLKNASVEMLILS